MNDSTTQEQQNLEQLAAALNHQVTDESGQVAEGEEPSEAAPAAPETKAPDEETPTAEKPAEQPDPSQAAKDASESELGVDDAGKRYVPQDRFKEVYGKFKATERELATLRDTIARGNALFAEGAKAGPKTAKEAAKQPDAVPEKADVLELKMTLPQFDPKEDENGVPTNPDYSHDLDELGFQIWKANPGLSLVDAGKKAVTYAKSLAKKETEAKTEARLVKTSQADHGLTTGSNARAGGQPVNVDAMNDKEIERYLKETGQW